MSGGVAIIGVAHSALRPLTPDLSFKELMYEAAVRAYEDAGVDPRRDVDRFISCAEDFLEGTSICDIHVPDQLGAVLKPVHTICSDGIFGLAAAYMHILTEAMDMEAVFKDMPERTGAILNIKYFRPRREKPVRENEAMIRDLKAGKLVVIELEDGGWRNRENLRKTARIRRLVRKILERKVNIRIEGKKGLTKLESSGERGWE